MKAIVVRNGKVRKTKKWHKTLLKSVQGTLRETCPILDLDHKELLVVINIDSFNKITTLIFHWEKLGNPVLILDNIIHSKDKLESMGKKLGLLRL